jgi:hypothetical protein
MKTEFCTICQMSQYIKRKCYVVSITSSKVFFHSSHNINYISNNTYIYLPRYNWNIVENGVKYHNPTKWKCRSIQYIIQMIETEAIGFFQIDGNLSVTQFCTNNSYSLNRTSSTLFMIDYWNTKITINLKESYRFCLNHLNYILSNYHFKSLKCVSFRLLTHQEQPLTGWQR